VPVPVLALDEGGEWTQARLKRGECPLQKKTREGKKNECLPRIRKRDGVL